MSLARGLIRALPILILAGGFTSATGAPASSGDVKSVACRNARVARLEFEGVLGYLADQNYCEFPDSEIPVDALRLLEKAGALNVATAKVLGRSVDETFRVPVGMKLSADPLGSLVSEARGGGVVLNVLPEWSFSEFSSKIYVHEIVHTLAFNDGPTFEALRGLRDHPFLVEALPDLITAAVHGSAKMELGEADLPPSLRFIRDENPSHSLDAPFGRYYKLASFDEVIERCKTFARAAASPLANRICDGYASGKVAELERIRTFSRNYSIVAAAYTTPALATPFEADHCRVETENGLVFLENCDPHQFAYPLVSFFTRLEAETGRSVVAEFIAKIREGASGTAEFECRFAGGTLGFGGVPATVELRPLLGAFVGLRESFVSSDRAAFDRAWKEHGFGKLVDLDRLYRNESLSGAAQRAVMAKNAFFSDLKGCSDVYRFDSEACQVTCEKRR